LTRNEVACLVAFAAGLEPEPQFDLSQPPHWPGIRNRQPKRSRAPPESGRRTMPDLLFDCGNAEVDLPGRETMTKLAPDRAPTHRAAASGP
jgi:hypothetical protein